MFIAYEFPPMGGVSSIWAAKYVKYLPSFGWEPVVVTVRDAPTNLLDPGLSGELPPATRVERPFSLEPTRLIRSLRRLREYCAGNRGEGEPEGLVYSYTGLPFRSLAKIRALFVPDEKIGWFPFALASCLKAVTETGARVVFSTAPPFTTHLIAAACKRITGLPWICEFRDPWVDYTLAEPPTPINKRINRLLEGFMVRGADAIVCAMRGIVDGFEERYPDVPGQRYNVITGGYDPEDFPEPAPPLEERFTMTWIGTMYGDRCPRGLFAALRDMIAEGVIEAGECTLRVVGTMDVEALEALRDAGLDDILELTGFVEYRESLDRMRSSHLLLMQLGKGRESEMVYTGKMFEYFASRRPILAFAEGGATSKLIAEVGAGTTVSPDNLQAIRGEVLRHYSRYKRGEEETVGDPGMISAFDKRELTGQLARLMDGLANGKRAR